METDDIIRIYEEIMDYCEKEGNYSYYYMKAYAAVNKPEWIAFLKNRNRATMIATCLKEKKREQGVKYNEPIHVSYGAYAEAMAGNEEKQKNTLPE